MRVARIAVPRADVDVPICELNPDACGVLPDRAAVELSQMIRDREVAVHAPAMLQFIGRDQNVPRLPFPLKHSSFARGVWC